MSPHHVTDSQVFSIANFNQSNQDKVTSSLSDTFDKDVASNHFLQENI